MATLLGGINRQAVAPEMMEYGDRLDTQLNNPQKYYSDPSENLLLNTNKAFDMADRGQIARSEVPVIGYLNSNMKDTETREKALGMDLMNRQRFANDNNKVEALSPEEFTKTLSDNVKANTALETQKVAPLPSVTPQATQATPSAGLQSVGQQGVTPEMTEAMNQAKSGITPLGNEMMYNPNITLGRGGRELGQSDIVTNEDGTPQYGSPQAMAYAKAMGYDVKANTTTEKRINPDTGNTEERVTVNTPYIQEGYDENMNISTPRLGYKLQKGEWKITKLKTKKTGSGKTAPKKTVKLTHKGSTLKENIIDNMGMNQKFIDYTLGKSEGTKQSAKEYSRLMYHKTMLENLDDQERKQYIMENDLGGIDYTELVDQVNGLETSLKNAGLDVSPLYGASMWEEAKKSAQLKYETWRPIGMNEDVEITFANGGHMDIDDGINKRNQEIGYDGAGNGYIKMTFEDARTGEDVLKIFPVKDLTEQKKSEFLRAFTKSGANNFGVFGTTTTTTEDDSVAKNVSYLGNDKEKKAYLQGVKLFDEFNDKIASAGTMDVAVKLYDQYSKDMNKELKGHPSMLESFIAGATPIDHGKDGQADVISSEKRGQLLSVLDKKLAREKGYVGKQKRAIDEKKEYKVNIGQTDGKANTIKYKLTPSRSGIKITMMSTKIKGKVLGDLPDLVDLNYVTEKDINTRVGVLIKDYLVKENQVNEDDKVLRTDNIHFLN